MTTLLLALSLAACGTDAPPAASTPDSTPSQSQDVDNTQAPSQSETLEEPSQTPADDVGEAGPSILVAYFSWSGNTRTMAEAIQTHLDTDLFEITTVNGYSEDYNTVLDEAQAEQRENARPELAEQVEDMEQYDVVFLGYPNWWGDAPMAIYSFLDAYDLSGKTVIPFVTSGGSGFSRTISAIEEAEPEATVIEGLALSGSSVGSAGDQITQWLDGLALTDE